MQSFAEFVKELNQINELAFVQVPGAIYFVDLDETLFYTYASIGITKNGVFQRYLSNREYNTYKLASDEEYDFSQFKSAKFFAETSKPIEKMIRKVQYLLSDIGPKNKVVILTARTDLDDKDMFLNALTSHGLPMSKIYVERTGNMQERKGFGVAENKKRVINSYLKTGQYKKAILIDDSPSNLKKFMELESEYPDISFTPLVVLKDGKTKVFKTNSSIKTQKN